MLKVSKNTKKYGTLEVILDEEGLKLWDSHNWSIGLAKNTTNKIFYVLRKDAKGKTIRFHREILNICLPNIYVDHINGNGLDNRRINLRQATPAENSRNARKNKKKNNQYKGISQRPSGKYRTRIRVDTKLITLGEFDSKHAAAIAYNIAAKKYFGQFANLNKIGSSK